MTTCCPPRTSADCKPADDRPGRDARGRFLPGNRYGRGRPWGSKNRIPLLLDLFARAVDQDGGEAFIVEYARRFPARFQRVVARVVSRGQGPK